MFGVEESRRYYHRDALTRRFPVRIRKFVLVNAPVMFPLVWRLIKPMMSEDLASKFTFVKDANVSLND